MTILSFQLLVLHVAHNSFVNNSVLSNWCFHFVQIFSYLQKKDLFGLATPILLAEVEKHLHAMYWSYSFSICSFSQVLSTSLPMQLMFYLSECTHSCLISGAKQNQALLLLGWRRSTFWDFFWWGGLVFRDRVILRWQELDILFENLSPFHSPLFSLSNM